MNSSALAPLSDRAQKTIGDPYLKVKLNAHTIAVLEMPYILEAIVLPARRLTPIPNMPPCVLGLTNRRSQILWVLDLPRLLDMATSPTIGQQHSAVIVKAGSTSVGLVVQQVEGVTWLQPGEVQPPLGQVSTTLLPYLQGCVLKQRDLFLLLNIEAIVQSPVLHHFS